MGLKPLEWSLFALLVAGALALFVYSRKPQILSANSDLKIETIRSSSDDSERAPQDVVVFSDGSELTDLGYEVTEIGQINPANAKPFFLFKAVSCLACEPEVWLWIFSAEHRQAEKFPFPGNHFLLSEDDDATEVLDFTAKGVFGRCGSSKHSVVIAQKQRNVDSDGTGPVVSENWDFLVTEINLLDDGKTVVKREVMDGFDKIKSLVGGECFEIAGEDRHDYL